MASSTTPQALPEQKQKEKVVAKMFTWLAIILLVALLLSAIYDAIGGVGSKDSKSSDLETVATIECEPNRVLYTSSGGWCYSDKLAAGTYRLQVRSANIRLAIWNQEQTRIIDSTAIPPEGMSLTAWTGQPYEKQFLEQAPLPKLKRVGTPIARVGAEKPFDPRKQKRVTLERAERIGVSLNVIPTPDSFHGLKGKVVIDILG